MIRCKQVSPLFELTRVLVRLNDVARFIVNAGDRVMWAGRKTRLPSRYFCPEFTSTGRLATEALQDGSRPELGDGKLVGGRL